MNYGQLKTAIGNWIARSDLTADIPQIVEMAEASIRRDVRVSAMESLTTGTLSGGSVPLPDRFLESRQLLVAGELHTYVPPETYQVEAAMQSRETHFTVIGGALYVVNGGSQAYSLLAYRWFDALSGDADTNWILSNNQDVYLFQCLKLAAVFLKDAASAQGYEQLYQQAKDAVNSVDRAGRFAGSLTTRARVVA